MAADRDESGVSAGDLRQQAVERVAFDQLRVQAVERLGLRDAALERRLRLLGQLCEHLGHAPSRRAPRWTGR